MNDSHRSFQLEQYLHSDCLIEEQVGPPNVEPIDAAEVDSYRKSTYLSYESFLRNNLSKHNSLRKHEWKRDFSSVENYLVSVESKRDMLKKMLGFWIEPDRREEVNIIEKKLIRAEQGFDVYRLLFEITEGVHTYAIELVPETEGTHPGLLVQHGYGGSPELVCGFCQQANMEDYSYRSLGIRAVKRNYHVIAVHHPSGFGFSEETIASIPGFEDRYAYGKNRLHRLALLQNSTLFGLDMLASSRGIDILLQNDDVEKDKIGMYGLSQGGQSALYLPALDRRIKASVCSAYFNNRIKKLIGPYKGVTYLDSLEETQFYPNVLKWFFDSDIASLIIPRAFAVEAGEKDTSVDYDLALEEFGDVAKYYDRLHLSEKVAFIGHRYGHISATKKAFDFIEKNL
ncbi:MAG: alpha/beta hydrolase family protein [Sedimentisphaeraceae bacterium JB056]